MVIYSNWAVLKPEWASGSPGGLVKPQIPRLQPQIFWLSSSEVGPENLHLNNFQVCWCCRPWDTTLLEPLTLIQPVHSDVFVQCLPHCKYSINVYYMPVHFFYYAVNKLFSILSLFSRPHFTNRLFSSNLCLLGGIHKGMSQSTFLKTLKSSLTFSFLNIHWFMPFI